MTTDASEILTCTQIPQPPACVDIVVDGKSKMAIRVSSADAVIPRSMLQGRREAGTLYIDGSMSDWFWQGFTTVKNDRLIYFEHLDLLPFTSLFSMAPERALTYIIDLARALQLRSVNHPLSLDAIHLIRSGGVLILSDEIQVLQQSQKHDELRNAWYDIWVHPGLSGTTGLIFYLTGLLYAVYTGRPPLADQMTREDSRRPIPIDLLVSGLDGAAASWIDHCLRSSGKKRSSDLSLWIGRIEHLPSPSTERAGSGAANHRLEQLNTYLRSQHRRATRNMFLRQRGSLLVVVAVVGITLIMIASSFVARALEPPVTIGMTQEEVVHTYFAAIEGLDSELIDETLARGIKSPLQQTIIYLYVTTKTRLAYEQTEGLVAAADWVAQGTPELPSSTIVFGVTDLELRRMDEDTIEASYTLWLPGTGSEESSSEALPESTYRIPIIADHIVEEFVLEFGSRKLDHYLIGAIRQISRERAGDH